MYYVGVFYGEELVVIVIVYVIVVVYWVIGNFFIGVGL